MKIEALKEQILLSKEKTDTLVSDISKEKWLDTPSVLETNLNWQIGHIVLANYLHAIASIIGADSVFREKVNVANFIKFYGPKSNPKDFENEKPSTEDLLTIYEFTFNRMMNALNTISDRDLKEDTAVPNPSAKTKYKALLWVSQHHSWHNGQIAVLKRILNS